MRPRVRLVSFLLLVVAGLHPEAVPAARAQADRLQAVEAFFSPSAALFAADGRTLYVANSARGDYGMLAEQGAISRCRVSDDGKLTVTEPRFCDGLNAPLGLAILATATSVSPPGALVAAVGGSWTTDARGRALDDDRARMTGLVLVDANDGRQLGRIFLGEGSPVVELLGHAIMDPIAVAADPAGNLYLADFAARGTRADNPGDPVPGVLKLAPPAIEALLEGKVPPADAVSFVAVRNVPTGLAYSTADKALYWVTGLDYYDLGGAVLRVPGGDLSGHAPLQTVAKELTSLNGIGLTPKGTVLVARNSGDILIIRGRRGRPIDFGVGNNFLSPGQIATTTLANGRVFVVVPEAGGGGRRPWRHRVRTFVLGGNY